MLLLLGHNNGALEVREAAYSYGSRFRDNILLYNLPDTLHKKKAVELLRRCGLTIAYHIVTGSYVSCKTV